MEKKLLYIFIAALSVVATRTAAWSAERMWPSEIQLFAMSLEAVLAGLIAWKAYISSPQDKEK